MPSLNFSANISLSIPIYNGIKMRQQLALTGLLLTMLWLAGCSRHPSHLAQGYMEGRYTYMATSVSGRLEKLLVQRGTKVKAGQILFVLQSRPEMDAYVAALANEEQALLEKDVIKPNLEYARLTYNRYKTLVPKNAIQQSELDSATANYASLQSQLSKANAGYVSAKANAAQAEWNKDQKVVVAPVDAMVFDTYYRLGEYTQAGSAIMSLLAPADIKAIFYVPEKYLGSIQLGDVVHVRCDGCDKDVKGQVSFISPTVEYTPPVIYSNETNQKLIYRIEAAFDPAVAVKLHPGQPVSVTYYSHG